MLSMMVLDWQDIGNVYTINEGALFQVREQDGWVDIYPFLYLKNYIMIDLGFLQYVHGLPSVVKAHSCFVSGIFYRFSGLHGYTCADELVFHECTFSKPEETFTFTESSFY